MIGYLKGKILSLNADSVLLQTQAGIGFEVLCSSSALSLLSGKTEGELFTYLNATENGIALYGFVSKEEKDMFLKLITVSGVGPKMGIAVLSGMNLAELVASIATSNVKKLSSIKGLGKKTAERIILELREKVGFSGEQAPISEEIAVKPKNKGNEDAIVALMSLGFTRAESEKAVAGAMEKGAKSVEDIIMLALKGM